MCYDKYSLSVTRSIVMVLDMYVCVCLSVVYSQCSVVILYQNNDHVSVSKYVCARVSNFIIFYRFVHFL